jgi:ketose-bisphosphate aldolase
MAIAPLKDLLAKAQRDGYAVTYCESWNLESVQAVIEAAEETRSPAVIGFNGGFLSHQTRTRPEDLSFYAGFRAAIDRAAVPLSLLLNESTDLRQMTEAIALGFNAVMPDNEGFSDDTYSHLVREVVSVARPAGVFVEAQLGHLANGRDAEGHDTDPDLAAGFVESTGIDALAIAVGNVHILTEGKCRLNLEAIHQIRRRVSVPLVLHGGTGVSEKDLQAAIQAGVAKVNFGTRLKQAYLEAVRSALNDYRPPMSPHPFLGIGGEQDIMSAGRDAVRRETAQLMCMCGSAGKAL